MKRSFDWQGGCWACASCAIHPQASAHPIQIDAIVWPMAVLCLLIIQPVSRFNSTSIKSVIATDGSRGFRNGIGGRLTRSGARCGACGDRPHLHSQCFIVTLAVGLIGATLGRPAFRRRPCESLRIHWRLAKYWPGSRKAMSVKTGTIE
jgi:hypothetical protein